MLLVPTLDPTPNMQLFRRLGDYDPRKHGFSTGTELGQARPDYGNDKWAVGRETYDNGLLWFVVVSFVVGVIAMGGLVVILFHRSGKVEERAINLSRETQDLAKGQVQAALDMVASLQRSLEEADKRHAQELADQSERHAQAMNYQSEEHRKEKEAMRVRHNDDRDYWERDRDRILRSLDKANAALTTIPLHTLSAMSPHPERSADGR